MLWRLFLGLRVCLRSSPLCERGSAGSEEHTAAKPCNLWLDRAAAATLQHEDPGYTGISQLLFSLFIFRH